MKRWSVIALILLVGVLFGVSVRSGEVDAEPSEATAEFLNDYAEMRTEADPENILMVVGDLPGEYGASGVVKAPGGAYFLRYDTAEQREVAYVALVEQGAKVARNHKSKLASYLSWGVEAMGLDAADAEVNRQGLGGDVVVAIIDTGVNVEMFEKYFPEKKLTVYNVLAPEGEMTDTNGHGTHIAGTVAEATPDDAEVMVIKASTGEELYDSDIIDGIYYAKEHGADVLSLSIGGYYDLSDEGEYAAWEYEKGIYDEMEAAGLISVAAAGNEGISDLSYPASYDSVISVAAVDSRLEKADFSNFGSEIDFAAPGVRVKGLNNNAAEGDFVYMSGTSMATPHVASAAAVLKGLNNDLRLGEVKQLMRGVAVDLGLEGWDIYYGWGLVDFGKAKFCEGTLCDDYGVFTDESKVRNVAANVAEVSVDGKELSVRAEKACVVVGVEGEEYVKVAQSGVKGVAAGGGGGAPAHLYNIDGYEGVYVALKGDVDMNGRVNSRDSALINYSLPSVAGSRHQEITDGVKLLIADVDGNGKINSRDSALINYSLPSVTGDRHKELSW